MLFRVTSLNWDTPISLRDILTALLGITTIVTAIDLWIKYAWGLLLYEWPLEPRHNLIYLGVGLCETGLALSINVISVWLFLAGALCVASIIAYLYNENLALEEFSMWAEKLKRTNVELPEAPVRTSWIEKFMWKRSFLRQSNKFELFSALSYAILMVTFGVLVLILPQVQIFAIIGVGLSLLCATYDLLTQAVIMVNQRTITRGL